MFLLLQHGDDASWKINGHLATGGTATGQAIIDLLRQLNAEDLTFVVVTHNSALASAAQRHITLRDGQNTPA